MAKVPLKVAVITPELSVTVPVAWVREIDELSFSDEALPVMVQLALSLYEPSMASEPEPMAKVPARVQAKDSGVWVIDALAAVTEIELVRAKFDTLALTAYSLSET